MSVIFLSHPHLDFLDKYKVNKVYIFKIHNLVDEKYKKLNMNYYYHEIDDDNVNKIYELLKDKSDRIEILKY